MSLIIFSLLVKKDDQDDDALVIPESEVQTRMRSLVAHVELLFWSDQQQMYKKRKNKSHVLL